MLCNREVMNSCESYAFFPSDILRRGAFESVRPETPLQSPGTAALYGAGPLEYPATQHWFIVRGRSIQRLDAAPAVQPGLEYYRPQCQPAKSAVFWARVNK